MKKPSYQWTEAGIATTLEVAHNHIAKMMNPNPAISEEDRALQQCWALDALSEAVKQTVHLMAIVARGPKAAGLLIEFPDEPKEENTRIITFDSGIRHNPFWTS